MERIPKDYLGDGVYVDQDPYGSVILTTEDGIRATNTIYLEPGVIQAFLRYLQRIYPNMVISRKEPND